MTFQTGAALLASTAARCATPGAPANLLAPRKEASTCLGLEVAC